MNWFSENILLIITLSLSTMLSRFLPFIFYNALKGITKKSFFKYMPTFLLCSLVAYCYRDFTISLEYATRIIAGIFVIFVHIKMKNLTTSVLSGTIFYQTILLLENK